jgi:hypothetical protein
VSIDLWGQFVNYVSSPSVGGFVSLLIAVTLGALGIIKECLTILRSSNSSGLFGMGRRIRAHKYLGLIENVEGLDDDSCKSVNSLKNALFDDIKVDIIHTYLDERYKRWISRFTSELLLVSFAWFVVVRSLDFAVNLLDSSKLEAYDLFDVKTLFAVTVVICVIVLMLIIIFYIVIELPRRFARWLGVLILQSLKKMHQLSLIAILSNLNPGQPYLFIDATVHSDIPSSPVIGNSNDVSILACIREQERENLWRSELLQSFREGSDERIADLVTSFLWEKDLYGKDLVYFVYSRYGLSAIQVTSALQDRGLAAHYIGKIDGRSKELGRAIKEVELLRRCGLK